MGLSASPEGDSPIFAGPSLRNGAPPRKSGQSPSSAPAATADLPAGGGFFAAPCRSIPIKQGGCDDAPLGEWECTKCARYIVSPSRWPGSWQSPRRDGPNSRSTGNCRSTRPSKSPPAAIAWCWSNSPRHGAGSAGPWRPRSSASRASPRPSKPTTSPCGSTSITPPRRPNNTASPACPPRSSWRRRRGARCWTRCRAAWRRSPT